MSETALALRPEERSELEAEAPRNAAALATLEAFTIATPADLAFAGDVLAQVSSRWSALEAKRTSITKPLLAAKRATDELFEPAQRPLKRAGEILRGKIEAYELAQRATQAATMQAVAAGEAPAEALADAVPAALPAGISVGSIRWEPQVAQPDMVPREYCAPDMAKLRAIGAEYKSEHAAPPSIPGVWWVLRGTVRTRVGK